MKTASTLLRQILLPLAALALLFSNLSCYCWRAGHETTRTCAAVHNVIDCMKPEVQKQMKDVMPAVAALLAGGAPELSAIAALEGLSYAGVVCAVNAVKLDAEAHLKSLPSSDKLGVSPEIVKDRLANEKMLSNFATWKAAHPDIDVKTK